MQPTDKKYFADYQSVIGEEVDLLLKTSDFSEWKFDLLYQTQASAGYSSNIEGNSIDLNSFMNYKLSKSKLKPQKEIEEIENLISAYEYAQANELQEVSFLHCHKLFAKLKAGKYRKEKVGVFDQAGLVYLAVEAELLEQEIKEFFYRC